MQHGRVKLQFGQAGEGGGRLQYGIHDEFRRCRPVQDESLEARLPGEALGESLTVQQVAPKGAYQIDLFQASVELTTQDLGQTGNGQGIPKRSNVLQVQTFEVRERSKDLQECGYGGGRPIALLWHS